MLSAVAMNRVPMYARSQPRTCAAYSARPSATPPARTTGPSNQRRTARTNANPLAHPVCPPAPAVSSTSPSAPASTARRAWWTEATSASTRQPASCNGATTGAGEPTLVMTTSAPWAQMRSTWVAAAAWRTMTFGQYGASAGPRASSKRPSHSSSSSSERQLAVGNAPMAPARHAASTRSGPDTWNIGAATSGSRNRDVIVAGSPGIRRNRRARRRAAAAGAGPRRAAARSTPGRARRGTGCRPRCASR